MRANVWLAVGLLSGLCIGSANAQTGSDSTGPSAVGSSLTRNPALGDPIARSKRRARRSHNETVRAHNEAVQDKQGPGTENGNQPDRASAGGGGR